MERGKKLAILGRDQYIRVQQEQAPIAGNEYARCFCGDKYGSLEKVQGLRGQSRSYTLLLLAAAWD